MQQEITETIETLEGDVRTVVKTIRRESHEQEFERRLGELMQKPKDAWTDKDKREAEFLIRALNL